MHLLSTFAITAAVCALLLTGCSSASDTITTDGPDVSRQADTVQPSSTPAAAAAPTSTPAPEESPDAEPTPTPLTEPDAESDPEGMLFDTDSADYFGPVTEMTDTGFCLSPVVVYEQGSNASVAVAAEAGTSAAVPVICTDDTRYIAIYADGNGNSSQEEGSADLVRADATVYITGSRTDGGFTADTVAILNP